MSIEGLSKKNKVFWSHFSVFDLEKQANKLNFQSFSTLRDPLVASFHKTPAPTSRKYVAEQGILVPN